MSGRGPGAPGADSAAALWRPLRGFIARERALGRRAGRTRAGALAYELLRFGVKMAWACLFGAIMLALILATAWLYPKGAALTRYDFLTLSAIAVQIAMLRFGLETWEEARVIALFHVVGTAMEIFKTQAGSWIYPEPALLRIAGVPLFTGFMYASVGSFIARVWRLCDFRFDRHPPMGVVIALAVAIYVNFFAHHFVADIRLALFAATALVFARTVIWFKVWRVHRPMPLLAACFLTSLFIWIAENVGTLTKTWLYPHQVQAWSMVGLGKLGAWFLLLVISYAMVAAVARPQPRAQARASAVSSVASASAPAKT
ncbi:MAG: DUF817 domain-containing protein [Methylobacteriaceae bacterium]|nr:DUF817 domain-containing protein [Methylobacteriaceae bacterium]